MSKRKSVALATVPASLDVKIEVTKLLSKPTVKAAISSEEWAVGRSKVFLKSDVIPKLESIDVSTVDLCRRRFDSVGMCVFVSETCKC